MQGFKQSTHSFGMISYNRCNQKQRLETIIGRTVCDIQCILPTESHCFGTAFCHIFLSSIVACFDYLIKDKKSFGNYQVAYIFVDTTFHAASISLSTQEFLFTMPSQVCFNLLATVISIYLFPSNVLLETNVTLVSTNAVLTDV